MTDLTAEERAQLLLNKHFIRDEVAGYIPIHYNQFQDDLPEAIRQAEEAAVEREREDNCRAICPRCADGQSLLYTESAVPQWTHLIDYTEGQASMPCDAHAIRAKSTPPAGASGASSKEAAAKVPPKG